MKPLARRRHDDRRVEDALRASLRANARQAPSGVGLAERVLAAVDQPPPVAPRPTKRWSAWAMPAVAAASVAAVAAIAVGIDNIGSGPTPVRHPRNQQSQALHGLNKPQPDVSATVGSGVAPSRPTAVAVLHHVRVLDLSFAGTDDGWALASADCLTGPGRCTALLRTHDGTHWQAMSGAAFNVRGVHGCASPCVEHLRFANDRVGYAFGPSAFFMTTNGGRLWQREPGGALALETLSGNVVRVSAHGTGCPGWCDLHVETAAIGSTAWTAAKLPEQVPNSIGSYGISFARGGSDAYLLSLGDPAGGAMKASSTLYRSTDNGQSWSAVGEPCPPQHGEVDSSAVAAGGADRVAFVCTHRQPPQRSFVATSSDAGLTVAAQPGRLPWPWTTRLGGDPSTVLAAAGPSGLAISRDGGKSWQGVPAIPGGVAFVGFENSRVGRVVAQHGRSIWTTRDGGSTWTSVRFG